MNARCYRTVFCAVRGMLVAVKETATSTGKGRNTGTRGGAVTGKARAGFSYCAMALGIGGALGLPWSAQAQVTAAPGSGAHVVQTQNGLPQVDIARPNNNGVSLNTYSAFNVPSTGVILNNASNIVSTQQAGFINGNPNLLPGASARVIVNQVTSTQASTLQGYLEVAGPRAEVVVSNPNGILVNGAGFINTSRATLTTGVPVFGGSGSLDAYRVSGGQIAVQGAGLNANQLDQVDLIARAVTLNAAVYANRLNVIAGANQVDRDTLAATAIAAVDAAPAYGIDASQLGGMYANKIVLASTEQGVGVSLRGVTAAQAGDLTLTAQGKLVLAGQTSASGKLAIAAQAGIEHSGTTYAQQGLSITTAGDLANSGALTAQQHVDLHAANLTSTGMLGAGVNSDGSIGQSGDLSIVASGRLSATGQNVAAHDLLAQGAQLSLAGSKTSAKGQLNLAALAGDLDLSGATVTVGSNLNANAQGALLNRGGVLSSQGATRLHAGGAFDNTRGNVQAGGALSADAASLDNTAGRLASLNTDGLSLSTGGALTNAGGSTADGVQGGVIGGNGVVQLSAGALRNAGQINAAGDATVNAASIDNGGGKLQAGGALQATASGALGNQDGSLSGQSVRLSAQMLDNRSGHIDGQQLALSTTGDLLNRGGSMNAYGTADSSIQAGGLLDNSGGSIAANSQNLTLGGQRIANDGGKLAHAGTGTLSLAAQQALSNANHGQLQTNGALNVRAGALDNRGGTASAQGTASVITDGDLLNSQGAIYGQTGLSLSSGGQLDNTGGSAQTAGNLSAQSGAALSNANGNLSANGAHGTLAVTAASIDNTAGHLVNAGDGTAQVVASTAINNSNGSLGGNGDVMIGAATLGNTGGARTTAAGALALRVSNALDNRGGLLYGGRDLTLAQAGAALINDGGSLLGGQDVTLKLASLSNANGSVRANRDILATGALSGSGEMTAGRDLLLTTGGDYLNDAANRLRADGKLQLTAGGTLTNTGKLGASGDTSVQAANIVNAAGGDITGATTTVTAGASLNNAGRLEGNTVKAQGATLSNTGTIVGGTVQLQANDLSNTGAAAVIAGAQDLKLYAVNSVSNLDGAAIYSGGNLQIARDGSRDPGTGLLSNQVGVLNNRSASIDADGDIDIAARAVNNTRTSIVTAAGVPQTVTQTLTAWYAGFSGDDMHAHSSVTFRSWNWNGENAPISANLMGALRQPITVTVDKSTVTNLDATNKTLSFSQVPVEVYRNLNRNCSGGGGDNGPPTCDGPETLERALTRNATQYYQSIQDNGSTYAITFWPDWDPHKNIRPDDVRVRIDLGSDSHDYSETSRTVTTTTATDQLISASDPARLRAGGSIRINSNGGAILNQSSIMAAGGNLVRSAVGGSVQDIGTALQQSVSSTETSTFYWHQKTGGDQDTKTVPYPTTPLPPTTVMALAAIASANQAVQTVAQNVAVTTVNRVGATVTGSGVAGGRATGTPIGGVSGEVERPQTVGGTGGLPNLSLPLSGLFHIQPAPEATYLVATDARYTQYQSFISSDYMLGALGLDPQRTQKRLGDGFYEEKLVRDQITQLTGRSLLSGYSNQLAQYQALMDAGVGYAKAFGLAPGIGLSDAQMQQLTTNMVWLVAQEVALPDGSHQSVLVPKLYLARANAVDLNSTGALVTGHAVDVRATGEVANSGRIVGDVATQVLGDNIVNRGAIGGAGSATVVQAVQDVRNLGGSIGGQDVTVRAGRDVVNETQTISQLRTTGPDGYSAGATGVGSVASISATGNVAVQAGRDISSRGAAVVAGGNAVLAAGRDVSLGTATLGTTQDAVSRGGQSYFHDQTTTGSGSTVQAGGNAVVVAGRDASLNASGIQAVGNASVVAGRDVTVTAAMDTHTHSEGSLGADAQYKRNSYDETARGSAVQAGNAATLAAGQGQLAEQLLRANGIASVTADTSRAGNVAVLGSSVSTGNGAAKLVATGDVTVGAVDEKHSSYAWSDNKHSGFLSHEQTTKESSSQSSKAVGSSISADAVAAQAGRDLTVQGSTVAASNDVDLRAGRDLSITTAQSSSADTSYEKTTHSGLGSAGTTGISYGRSSKTDTVNQRGVTQTGSLVGSTGGNVSLTAGNALNVTGSELIAAKDITGTGADVTIQTAQGSTHRDEDHEYQQSGFTLGVSGGVLDLPGKVLGLQQQLDGVDQSKNGRLAALRGVAAARDLYDAGRGFGDTMEKTLGPGDGPSMKVSLSFGSSRSSQTSTEDSTSNTGSRVTAGGKASFTATGVDANGRKTAGDLNIVGSDVNAAQVALKAAHDVNIVSATDTDESHDRNQSSSASLGVAYGFGKEGGGFSVSASASRAKGNADSSGTTQLNSHVNGRDGVSIVSGRDTNVQGGVVSGGKVDLDVGGDLNLASRQDTSQVRIRSQSEGGSLGISTTGASVSVNANRTSADGNYANVTEQSGIRAGDGGFDIHVNGNTDLKGAVIASTATPDKNRLSTGSLSWSDIQNHADYSADSMGASAGVSYDPSAGKDNQQASDKDKPASKDQPASAQDKTAKDPSWLSKVSPDADMPSFQRDSGNQDGVARSAVSAGTITITRGDAQKQDVATLSRDTTHTNSTVDKHPDLNGVLADQADRLDAAKGATGALNSTIGDIAGKQLDAANQRLKAADAAYDKDPSEANQAALAAGQSDVNNWKEGGDYRVALHTARGALVAGLGGDNALFNGLKSGALELKGEDLKKFKEQVVGQQGGDNVSLQEAVRQLALSLTTYRSAPAADKNADSNKARAQ